MELLNLDNYLAEITQQIYENQEEFIISTLYPFCQELVEWRISKQDLRDALTRWKELETENRILRKKLAEREK